MDGGREPALKQQEEERICIRFKTIFARLKRERREERGERKRERKRGKGERERLEFEVLHLRSFLSFGPFEVFFADGWKMYSERGLPSNP